MTVVGPGDMMTEVNFSSSSYSKALEQKILTSEYKRQNPKNYEISFYLVLSTRISKGKPEESKFSIIVLRFKRLFSTMKS